MCFARIWLIALPRSLPFLLPSSASLQKILRLCELPHIGAAKKCASRYRQAQRDVEGMQMRAWMVAIAVVVAIGLIWSFAAMSNLVPVDGSEMSLASISRPAE
jgi:hypothetical protein